MSAYINLSSPVDHLVHLCIYTYSRHSINAQYFCILCYIFQSYLVAVCCFSLLSTSTFPNMSSRFTPRLPKKKKFSITCPLQEKNKMRRDCGLALSLSPRAWDRHKGMGRGAGRQEAPASHPHPRGSGFGSTIVGVGIGGQCLVFWHFIYALEVGLCCQEIWGGEPGWWQGVSP